MSFKILLIEDSPTDAAILVAAFESIGYNGTIKAAQDGMEAIAALQDLTSVGRNGYPQIILLDLNLPRKNGHEVLREIKQHSDWKNIPTIIFSSSCAPKDINKSYELHANAYIAKPRELAKYEQVAQRIYDFWLTVAELPSE